MRNFFLGSIALVALIVGPATAADLPVRVPDYKASEPTYSWTGFYIGGNVGYSASDNSKSTTTFDDQAGPNHIVHPFTLAPSGWLGGGQIGYNWQFAPNWVVGLEGDWQWTGQKDSFCTGNDTFCGDPIDGTVSVDRKLQWFATTRARVGWAQGGWLLYVTGGGAWGQVKTNMSDNCPVGCGPNLLVANFTATSFSNTKGGWVGGGGIEVALSGNWTAKVEYLHLDLGTITNAFTGPGPYTLTLSGPIRNNIFRLGLNYRFG